MNLNYQTAISWSRAHKKLVAVLVVGIMLASYGIVRALSGGAQIQYVFATVERGTVVSAITGNGSISSSDRIDLSPDGVGDVTYVAPADGKFVKKGTVLVSLDAADEYQAVQNAQIDLQEARLALERLEKSQSRDVPDLNTDLEDAYSDIFNDISSAFLDLPVIMETADDTLYEDDFGGSRHTNAYDIPDLLRYEDRVGFRILTDRAEDTFRDAEDAYEAAFRRYVDTDRNATPDEVLVLLAVTETAAERIAHTLKTEQNLLDEAVTLLNELIDEGSDDSQLAVLTGLVEDVRSAISKLNSHIMTLANAKQDVEQVKRDLQDARELGPMDLASQQNAVRREELSLQKTQRTLADRSVRAPFDGVVSGLDVRAGESLSASTVVATIVTGRRIAELTFNEVDITSLEVGQKATLTFDAVEDLSLTGTVSNIDSLGTVSQGVVNYDVVIALDTSDDRVKPGMSVSASIVTAVSQNTLFVPAAAVKSSGETQYVEVYPETSGGQAVIGQAIGLDSVPAQRTVTTGISSDTAVEILSGLDEGDAVIVRTITGASTSSAQQAPSLFQAGGGGRTGGGNIRTFQAR